MTKSSWALSALFGVGFVVTPAMGDLSGVADYNRDGYVNVLDVAREIGLPLQGAGPRAATELIAFDPVESGVSPGGEVRVLVRLLEHTTPLFGYSLDIDVAPVMGATGDLVPNASLTNFFDVENLITAGGAERDGFFSVVQPSADNGLFLSTNTADASAVLATAGVNDVLAELVFDVSGGARGEFEITIGPGSALADANGAAVPFQPGTAVVRVEVEPVVNSAYYEMNDSEMSSNDLFENREVFSVNDPYCSYLSGKLQANRDPGRYPDTFLYMFDKDDNVVCEDDNSSNKGNGKASACFDIAPIPNGDGDDAATVRLGITGRPDGVDTMFNGLFFNAPHGQLGEAEVCVTYYDGGGGVLGTDVYLCTFVTGAEAFRVNYVVPEGTVSVDVEIDNTTETFPICNDVDYYEINGLEPTCDYVITVVGGLDDECNPGCEILAWYDKLGTQIYPISSVVDRSDVYGQGAQLSVIADVNGRVRLAVTGQGDEDFDGWLDEVDGAPRSIETPGYEPPPAHGCCSCYTLKIDWAKHFDGPGGIIPTGIAGAQAHLSNGDLNIDGSVNVIDLAIMLNNWGWAAP